MRILPIRTPQRRLYLMLLATPLLVWLAWRLWPSPVPERQGAPASLETAVSRPAGPSGELAASAAESTPAVAALLMSQPARSSAGPDAERALRQVALNLAASERFAVQQMQIRTLQCEGRRCELDLQLPPFADASRRRDSSLAAEFMDGLRQAYAGQEVEVALNLLDHGHEGMRMAFTVSSGSPALRSLSAADIAKLRFETLNSQRKLQGGAP